MISEITAEFDYDFVIKKVHLNMCLVLNIYGVMTARNLE